MAVAGSLVTAIRGNVTIEIPVRCQGHINCSDARHRLFRI